MRRYAHGEGCLMQFLQLALDDPDPAPVRPVLGLHRQAAGTRERGRHATTIEAARRFFRGQDVVVEPRKLWVERAARTARARSGSSAQGRALAFADDPAWYEELAELWRQRSAGAAGGAGRAGRGAEALVEDLAASGRGGADAVAALPDLGRSVAPAHRPVGRLPLVDALGGHRPAAERGRASAVRAKDLLYRTPAEPGVALRRAGAAGRRHRSAPAGPITVAGSLLADAGATSVLPLASICCPEPRPRPRLRLMKILVGYIPTPEGLAAVDWAIDYAKTMSGSLTVINTGKNGDYSHPQFASAQDIDALDAQLPSRGSSTRSAGRPTGCRPRRTS